MEDYNGCVVQEKKGKVERGKRCIQVFASLDIYAIIIDRAPKHIIDKISLF